MAGVVRLIDMVFPGDTNHHGTLFGGVALAHMDKVAFLAASRHGRAPFVTASSERIDFAAPALKGELIEATGRVVRVGTKSLDVEVELVAEALLSGDRRRCTRGLFTLVAVEAPDGRLPLPPLSPDADDHRPDRLHIASTRHARAVMVMAASDRVDFVSPVREGEMVELIAHVTMTGRRSVRVAVELWAEDLLSADHRRAASAQFVMVAVEGAAS